MVPWYPTATARNEKFTAPPVYEFDFGKSHETAKQAGSIQIFDRWLSNESIQAGVTMTAPSSSGLRKSKPGSKRRRIYLSIATRLGGCVWFGGQLSLYECSSNRDQTVAKTEFLGL